MVREDTPSVGEQNSNHPALEGNRGQVSHAPVPGPDDGLLWIFVGNEGLRAGWSVLIFAALFMVFQRVVGTIIVSAGLEGAGGSLSLRNQFLGELAAFLAMLAAAAFVALIEHRSILDFNLRGQQRVPHFLGGLGSGFTALSLLIGALALGGWLRFGPVALSGPRILKYAAAWGGVFLLVGLVEEGTMRCYGLFTLARGINFWLAAGINGAICLELFLYAEGGGSWGVYTLALSGVIPCFVLHLKRAPSGGFWQATWVTSTLFGFSHLGNIGENWLGIFATGFIGFVFCVSIRLTGSAWWAIGCHTAWDWAETYFFGTADSGFVAQGHYLSTRPVGNALWTGGADGPEGSILVLPVTVLLLVFLLVIYGRKKPGEITMAATERLAS